jgi:hypothetical protein
LTQRCGYCKMGGMKTKLLFLFVLFVGLCNAPVEVRLRLMSGEECASTVNLDTTQPPPDMYKQCMKLANQIVNEGPAEPSGYPLIQNLFEVVTPEGSVLNPDYFRTIGGKNFVELSLVKIPKEIMVLPFGEVIDSFTQKNLHITLILQSCKNTFCAPNLNYNKEAYYIIPNPKERTLDKLMSRFGRFLEILEQARDIDICWLVQKMDEDNKYIVIELRFDFNLQIPEGNFYNGLGQITYLVPEILIGSHKTGVSDIRDLQQEHFQVSSYKYHIETPLAEQQKYEYAGWRLTGEPKIYTYPPFCQLNQ